MRRKSFFVLLVLAFALIVAGAAWAGTLEDVLAAKKLRAGILADFAPWGFRGAGGEFEGYDIDLAKELAGALGVELDLVAVEAPARVPALASKKIDVIIACLTPTNERAKVVDFTIPYASAGLIPMVRADNDEIKSYKDLSGKKVAVVRGGVPDHATTKAVPGVELVRFDTIADAYSAFQAKKTDIFVEEDTFVLYQVRNNPEYKAVGEPFSRELISFAVRRGDQGWLNYLNNFLINLRFEGKNAELYEKWFGQKPADLTLR